MNVLGSRVDDAVGPLPIARRGGYIKTATVSLAKQCLMLAMRRAEKLDATMRSVSRDRVFAGRVAGGRFPR